MRKNQIILISIGVLVLIGLISYFAYFQKIIKSGTGAPKEEVPDLCTKFSEIQDTVRCETARAAVLEKYPGEIKYIRRTKIEIPTGILPDVKMEEKEVWLFELELAKPLTFEGDETEYQKIEVFILRDTGELGISKLMSESP